MIRFNFKGTLQRLAQVRAFLGDINTPGGLGDATASDILAARAGGAVMLPVMTACRSASAAVARPESGWTAFGRAPSVSAINPH